MNVKNIILQERNYSLRTMIISTGDMGHGRTCCGMGMLYLNQGGGNMSVYM